MGFVFDELIHAAVLFNNPGITKEEFVKILSVVKISTSTYSKYARWSAHSRHATEHKFGRDLMSYYSLAKYLSLPVTEQFKKFQQTQRDNNNLWVYAPHLDYWYYAKPELTLKVHHENELKTPKIITDFSYDELRACDYHRQQPEQVHIWHSAFTDQPIGIVTKIIKKTEFPYPSLEQYELIESEKDFFACDPPDFLYSCRVIPFRLKDEIKEFNRLEDVVNIFPQFHPHYRYNWDTKAGKFYGWGIQLFSWKQEKGRYYIDEKTFNSIPASFRCPHSEFSFGYTDLILTAEAIKKKAWKLFSYGGTMHTDNFLSKNPDSQERFEKAIHDSHTSLFAKQRDMTITEFLRMRLEK